MSSPPGPRADKQRPPHDEVVEELLAETDKPPEQRDDERVRGLRSQVILNEMFQFVGLLSPDGTLLECNRSVLEAAGISREDVIGKPVWETYWWAVGEETEEQLREAVERARQGELVRYDVKVRVTRDGTLRWIDFSCKPVRNTDGEVVLLVPEGRDIHEKKIFERRLEQRNEDLERFAHVISHDLREPLRMVSSYLELLETQYADELDADAEEFIQQAVQGAHRMDEQIQGLLRYSRVQTRGAPLEPVEAREALEAALDNLELSLEETEASLEIDELPTVLADESQLVQVFQNLIANAVKFSGDRPPRIEVASAGQKDGMQVISVRDHGIGLDPGEAEELFEPFARHPDTEDIEGTGIGLAICRRIVERHGGEIWADGEPGEGARFSFTLPAADG